MRKKSRKPRRRVRKEKTAPNHGEVRMTPQRRAVYKALMESHEHPTVRDLYEIAKQKLPGISLATIYNSLQALMQVGLVNEHRVTSGAARYCINKQPHVHLLDEDSGLMMDVHLREGIRLEDVFALPEGVQVSSMRAYLYGKATS